jgi:hypothetical protein|tara:strand:- start:117 stop:527 length:411 start_codon:yes stop_codon:yes gene_type:complete
MTWLAVKTTLKKIWFFFKTYWYIPLLLSWAVITWLIFRNSGLSIADILFTAEESYRKQIDILSKAHEDEIKKRDEVLRKYQETIDQLEAERKKRNEELSEKEKKRVKELAEKYKNDPETYVREIAERFGFKYVENK